MPRQLGPSNLEEARKDLFLESSEWTSGLQNQERIHFYPFKPQNLWRFVRAALGNKDIHPHRPTFHTQPVPCGFPSYHRCSAGSPSPRPPSQAPTRHSLGVCRLEGTALAGSLGREEHERGEERQALEHEWGLAGVVAWEDLEEREFKLESYTQERQLEKSPSSPRDQDGWLGDRNAITEMNQRFSLSSEDELRNRLWPPFSDHCYKELRFC